MTGNNLEVNIHILFLMTSATTPGALFTRFHFFLFLSFPGLFCFNRSLHVHLILACVGGVKRGRGRGNLGARGRKERNACKDAIVYSICSRLDSERENRDWSELIKSQSSTQSLFPIG